LSFKSIRAGWEHHLRLPEEVLMAGFTEELLGLESGIKEL